MPERMFKYEFKFQLTNGYVGSGAITAPRAADVPKLARKRFNLSLGAEITAVRRVKK